MMNKGSRWRQVICHLHCQDECLIRGFETIKHFTKFSQTRTRCTVPHLMMLIHKHGLITVDYLSICLSTTCEKKKERWSVVQRINLPMPHPLWHFGFLQSGRGIPETREPEYAYNLGWNFQYHWTVATQEFCRKTFTLMLSWRQRRTVCRQTQGSCLRTLAWWDAI